LTSCLETFTSPPPPQQSFSLASETWETDTAYGGDYTTTTYENLESGEPDDGTPETIFTNGEGQTSGIYQYHSEADAALARPPPPRITCKARIR
jgi:hypothetical protein